VAEQGRHPRKNRITRQLMRIFGPAQLSPVAPRRVPVDDSAGLDARWVLRRRPDGSTYLAPVADPPAR